MEKSIILLSLIFFSVLSCSKKKEELPENIYKDVIKEFNLKRTKEGKILWNLKAKEAEISNNIINLRGIEFELFHNSKKVKLNADKGRIFKDSNKVYLEGNIVIEGEGKKVYLDDLSYDEKSSKFYSKGNVREETDNLIIEGEGLVATFDLKKVEIIDNVRIKKK
mgnify:CR=1 FL=1